MSKFLCTFSGGYGDAIWSLATTQALSQIVGEPVDFAIMSIYDSLLPLIQAQPYIDKAFGVKDWIQVHTNHGAQPWHPPTYLEKKYERFWHLGYRGHPGLGDVALPLIDYIAYQQGLKLKNPIPFLYTLQESGKEKSVTYDDFEAATPIVAYGFNDAGGYIPLYDKFMESLRNMLPDYEFVNTSKMPWTEALAVIKYATAFVGCRSSNWVLANGVGQRTITFEPHPARHASGFLGPIFGNPYGTEIHLPFNAPPPLAADVAKYQIMEWRRQEHESLAKA